MTMSDVVLEDKTEPGRKAGRVFRAEETAGTKSEAQNSIRALWEL